MAKILLAPDGSFGACQEMARNRKVGYLKKVNPMDTRELVAMFIQSPFYFDLHVRERLALVQHHYRRFSTNTKAEQCRLPDGVGIGLSARTNADKTVTIIVGFILKDPATDS